MKEKSQEDPHLATISEKYSERSAVHFRRLKREGLPAISLIGGPRYGLALKNSTRTGLCRRMTTLLATFPKQFFGLLYICLLFYFISDISYFSV